MPHNDGGETMTTPAGVSRDVVLKPYQVEHYHDMLVKLQRFFVVGNTSPPGTGKTVIAMACAKYYEFPILVVSPDSSVWDSESKRYGVYIHDNISYQSLRGTATHPPKRWLVMDKGKGKLSYAPTQELLNIIEDGTLFIFDEAEYLKNDSLQSSAARAIVKAVMSCEGGNSRVMLISSTLFDKHAHATNILKVMNIIGDASSHKDTPYVQVLRKCRKLDPITTSSLQVKYPPLTRTSINEFIYRCFVEVIIPNHFSSMPTEEGKGLDACNAFYDPTEEEMKEIRPSLLKLAGLAEIEKVSMKQRNSILDTIEELELAKCPMVARAAKDILSSDPKAKVVIMARHLKTLDTLSTLLSEYKHYVISGRVKRGPEREKMRLHFQEPNTEVRLIIANEVLSRCVSLDDTEGSYPRTMLIIPNFLASTIQQTVFRVKRSTTLSKAAVKLVYTNCPGLEEHKIMEALSQKGSILKEINGDTEIIYSSDYPRRYETIEEDEPLTEGD